MTTFTMRIQKSSGRHDAAELTWDVTDDDRFWAVRNHGQTLERLNERGGMSWCEMAAILGHRKHYRMDWQDAYRSVQMILLSRVKP